MYIIGFNNLLGSLPQVGVRRGVVFGALVSVLDTFLIRMYLSLMSSLSRVFCIFVPVISIIGIEHLVITLAILTIVVGLIFLGHNSVYVDIAYIAYSYGVGFELFGVGRGEVVAESPSVSANFPGSGLMARLPLFEWAVMENSSWVGSLSSSDCWLMDAWLLVVVRGWGPHSPPRKPSRPVAPERGQTGQASLLCWRRTGERATL